MTRKEHWLVGLIVAAASTAAFAAETIKFTYDPLGRLTKVEHNGTVNNNVITNYAYDNSDNRTNKKTTDPPP